MNVGFAFLMYSIGYDLFKVKWIKKKQSFDFYRVSHGTWWDFFLNKVWSCDNISWNPGDTRGHWHCNTNIDKCLILKTNFIFSTKYSFIGSNYKSRSQRYLVYKL